VIIRNKPVKTLGLTCGLLFFSALLVGCNDDDNKDNTAPVEKNKALEVNLIHINDSHSHLDEETLKLMLETSAGKREEIQVVNGGFARVTALINELANREKNAIKIHSGDAITGDLYFTLKEGEAEADL